MPRRTLPLILAGAAASAVLGFGSVLAHGPEFTVRLSASAARSLSGSGISASFRDSRGWLTRHPTLGGGEDLPDGQRAALARWVAALPGVGGVRWEPRSASALASRLIDKPPALHCQDDVNGVLKARSLRFAEASAAIDPASEAVLDEVATALRRCLGSVIAVTGHTDAAGDEPGNLVLSQQRAEAVLASLAARGIPESGLRARGWGSGRPLEGLEPGDPANRRIEFKVVTIKPVEPTPIDTAGAG